jgi:hypothetical protein
MISPEQKVSETDVTKQLLAKISVGYSPAADSTQNIAANAVRTWNAMQLIQKPKPVKTDINLDVYTVASTLGAKKLQTTFADMIDALATKVKSKADAGNDADALRAILTEIQKGSSSTYSMYKPYLDEIGDLRALLGGATPTAQQIPTKSQVGGAPATIVIPPPEYYHGAIYVQDATTSSRTAQFGLPQTPSELADKMNSLSDAQAIMQAFVNIYQYQANTDPGMTGEGAAAQAQALYNALSKLPSTDDLWSSGNFKTAMQNLKNGNLAAGMALLRNETVFNSSDFSNAIQNLFLVTINPRSLTTQQYGMKVKWNFDDNQDMFLNYIRGPTQYKEGTGKNELSIGKTQVMGFQPKALYVALAMHYAALSISGQWNQMQYNPNSLQSPLTVTGNRGQMAGKGQVIEGTASASMGVGLLNQPMEIVLNVSGGYKEWNINSMQGTLSDGTKFTIPPLSDKTGYLGIVSLDINFLDKEGENSRFQILPPAAIGGGIVGTQLAPGQKVPNAFGYVMFSATSADKNSWRVQTYVTPEVSYLMRELRVGGQFTPAQFIHATENYVLSMGALSKYEYNVKNYVSTMEVSANTRYVGTVFNFPLDVIARAGYATEFGGAQPDQVKGGAFLNLDLTIPFGRSPLSGVKVKKK